MTIPEPAPRAATDTLGLGFGCYVLGPPIGAGGTALVHVGLRVGGLGFRRLVAIKRLHAELAREPAMKRSLAEEARMGALIRSPNVVSALDLVADGGELALVLEWVSGLSLHALRGGSAPPVGCAVSIARDVLRGLEALHGARDADGALLALVHRDVSPHNVLVGIDGAARLADLGIARAAGRERVTATGEVKGKLTYMAPEQREGRSIDPRVDLFAVGIMLWELLTGERFFSGPRNAHALAAVLSRSASADVASALERAVSRLLEERPEDRPASAAEAIRWLDTSGCAASPEEVAEWVREAGGESLRFAIEIAERTQREEVGAPTRRDAMATEPTRGAGASRAQPRSPTSASRTLATGLALMSLVGSAYALARTPGGLPPSSATQPSGTSSEAASSIGRSPWSSGPRTIPPDPALEGAERAPTEARAQPSAASAPPPPPRQHPLPPPSSARSSQPRPCARPYDFDDRGIKVFRPECL